MSLESQLSQFQSETRGNFVFYYIFTYIHTRIYTVFTRIPIFYGLGDL